MLMLSRIDRILHSQCDDIQVAWKLKEMHGAMAERVLKLPFKTARLQ